MTRQPVIAKHAEDLLGFAVVATAPLAGGDTSAATKLRLSDGTSSVRFSACAQGEEWAPGQPYPDPNETQFNGGFFVRGAHCASLEVWADGQENPLLLALGLGTGDRPCPATSP